MTTDDELTYCANHPDTETGLKCNRCSKYICAKCAVQTAAGYRCNQCIKEQSRVFDTAEVQDFAIAFIISAVLSGIGAFLSTFIWFFFIFFLAPGAGTLIADLVQKAINRRRSKELFITATVGAVIGALPFLLFRFFNVGLYLFFVVPTVYARLSGIQFRR